MSGGGKPHFLFRIDRRHEQLIEYCGTPPNEHLFIHSRQHKPQTVAGAPTFSSNVLLLLGQFHERAVHLYSYIHNAIQYK